MWGQLVFPRPRMAQLARTSARIISSLIAICIRVILLVLMHHYSRELNHFQ